MTRKERTQMEWKRICTWMAMFCMTLFMVVISPKTVNAETFDCEVYYDVARSGVQDANAETGSNLQLDVDLCKIAKQIAVNEVSGLYGFKDGNWEEKLLKETGYLKSCRAYGGGYEYCYGDTLTVQKKIAERIKSIVRNYPDYNLIGVSVISDGKVMGSFGRYYYYQIVIGKGTCIPETNNGMRKEPLSTSDTVTLNNTSSNTNNSSNNNNSSSGSETNKPTKVTSVKIDKTSKNLLTGKQLTLSATVLPADASNKKLKWSVSNKKYATINQNGVLKAKAAGAGKTITVTAKAQDGSGKKATYKIKLKGAVSKITLKAQKSVKAGKKVTIKSTVKVGKGGSKALKWTSSNNSWATVNAKGVVTTKKAGKGQKVKITATAKDGSGKKASVTIKLK